MKNVILFFLILISFFSMKARSQDLGVGLMVGEPTGVTAKKMSGSKNAIDAGAGWSFRSQSRFHLYSDYLFIMKDGLYWNSTPLDVNFGVGGRMKFADEIEVGVRLPIGLSAFNDDRVFETFGEVVPVFNFISTSHWEIHMAFGLRYYF